MALALATKSAHFETCESTVKVFDIYVVTFTVEASERKREHRALGAMVYIL